MFEQFAEHDVAVYAGYADNDEKVLKSTSGGVATVLSEAMLAQGGYVAGVAYSTDFRRAEYIMVHDPASLARLRGSKYVVADKKQIYREVKQLLDSNENVLFFGLPCVVAGLYAFLGARPENLLTCELVCHGHTDAKVHADYVEYLEKTHHSKLTDFSVRYKKGAWTPTYLYAAFENGETYSEHFYRTQYGFAFNLSARDSCYHCRFKGNGRQGDLMVGDFWGATEEDEFWNPCGVSLIFAETEKGDAFLRAAPGLRLFPTTFERAVARNLSVIASRKKMKNRDKFVRLLAKKDLIYAVRHTTLWRIRVRHILSLFIPKRWHAAVKSAFPAEKHH